MSSIGSDIDKLKEKIREIRNDTSTQYEVEVRLSSYNGAKPGSALGTSYPIGRDVPRSTSGISFRQFHLVQRYFDSLNINPTVSITVDESQPYHQLANSTIRRTITQTDSSQSISWSLKTRLFVLDNRTYNLRYAVSSESHLANVNNFNPTFTRHKERYSYQYGNTFRIDLTKVSSNDNSSDEFELEIEIETQSQVRNIKVYDYFPRVIARMLRTLHDTEVIYSLNSYREIISFFNDTMSSTTSNDLITTKSSGSTGKVQRINHKMLFQARNLNIRDMVNGGLIGNDRYQYSVTIKADGERKLLVIHTTGVWLIMGPDAANLIYRFQQDDLQRISQDTNFDPTGTILEGELIPMDRRRNEGYNSKYLYLIYDCLARSTDNNDIGDSSVQEDTLQERMLNAQRAKNSLDFLRNIKVGGRSNNGEERSLMDVRTKEFRFFNTATQMFDIISSYERLKASNAYPYHDDGYIFTPNEMPYNMVAGYKGNQEVVVHWKNIDINVWQNEHGSIINRSSNRLIERPDISGVHYMISTDAQWYTERSMEWVNDSNNELINNWSAVSSRQWRTVNPNASRNAQRGARQSFETKDLIRMVDGDLWQTIVLSEKGRKPISKIPLHFRKLKKYPDICKWKPPNQLTIDFAVIRHGDHLQLLVSGFDSSLIPFTGTPAHPFITDPINQPYGPVDANNELISNIVDRVTIVEFAWDDNRQDPQMVPMRIRSDKTRPNQMSIANAVWEDIKNPIDIRTMKGETFRFMSKYHNRIKWQLFGSLATDNHTLLDIGSGVGGDILKMKEASRIVMVEPNSDHLDELQSRLRSIFHQQFTTIIEVDDDHDTVNRKLNESYQAGHRSVIVRTGGEDTDTISRVVNKWLDGPAQRLSLMLSLSFFWQDSNRLQGLANTILKNLASDGQAAFLTIDGRIVRHAFHPVRLTGVPTLQSSNQNSSVASSYQSSSNQPSSSQTLIDTTNAYSSARISGIGGQRSDYDVKKLGEATLRYSHSDDSLLIDIPDSIVSQQQEWLVYLDQLEELLRVGGFRIDSVIRADQETFMSAGEYQLSKLYTGGYIYSNKLIDTSIKSRKINQHNGPTEAVRRYPTVSSLDGDKAIGTDLTTFSQKLKHSGNEAKLQFQYSSNREVDNREIEKRVIRNSDGTVTVLSPTSRSLKPYNQKVPSIELPTFSSPVERLPEVESMTVPTPNVKQQKVKLPTIASKPLTINRPTIPSKPLTINRPTIASKPLTINRPTISSKPLTINRPTKASKPLTINRPTISSKPLTINRPTKVSKPLTINRPTISLKQPIVRSDNDLPMMPIRYDSSRDIGIGDDKIERLTVTWYEEKPVIRIATIGDGSCFFHAILKAFYHPYANNSSYSNRTLIVKKLRRDLAAMLSEINPLYPDKSYYESVSEGQWLKLYNETTAGVNIGIDFSLQGLENLLNSQRDVGNELYQYTADALQVDIYVMQATLKDLIPLAIAEAEGTDNSNRYGVVIAGNGRHYETVGIETNQGIQTVFLINHPFIQQARTKMDLI